MAPVVFVVECDWQGVHWSCPIDDAYPVGSQAMQTSWVFARMRS